MSLTIEPLTLDILHSFKEAEIHNGKDDLLNVFVDGLPPHQAIVMKDGEPVLLMGYVEYTSGVFWSYTLFSENWRSSYYPFVIKYARAYLKFLEFIEIWHIVDKEKPWTFKMAKMFGYEYVADIDNKNELWSVKHERWSFNARRSRLSNDAGYFRVPAE